MCLNQTNKLVPLYIFFEYLGRLSKSFIVLFIHPLFIICLLIFLFGEYISYPLLCNKLPPDLAA